MKEVVAKMSCLVTGIAAVLESQPDERTKQVLRRVYRLVVRDRARVAQKAEIARRQVDYR